MAAAKKSPLTQEALREHLDRADQYIAELEGRLGCLTENLDTVSQNGKEQFERAQAAESALAETQLEIERLRTARMEQRQSDQHAAYEAAKLLFSGSREPWPPEYMPPSTPAPREELAKTLHSVAYPDANFCLDRPECRARLREADAIIAAGWRKGMVGTPDIPDWSMLAKRYGKALANVYEGRVEYQAALWALTSACRAAAIKAYEAARLPDPNR
jgi:ParB-like chromosome segregation protein Spo0J